MSKSLTYGSIIRIIDIDNKFENDIFFVKNITPNKLELIKNDGLQKYSFEIDENGSIVDLNISKLVILHQPKDGYAKINKLIPGKFIKITFNDSNTLIGKIFFLEEDMIGIKLNDKEKTKIYIDFNYSGLDESYNIELIEFVDEDVYENKKSSIKINTNNTNNTNNINNTEDEEEYDGVMVYNIEQQVDNYAERMIKTKKDKKKVENEIEKYRQLLRIYTRLDEGISLLKLSENQIKNTIYNMNKNLIIPVTSNGFKHLYSDIEELEENELNFDELEDQYTTDEINENSTYSVLMHNTDTNITELINIMDDLNKPEEYLNNILLYNVKRKPEYKKIKLLDDSSVALINHNKDYKYELSHISICEKKISQNLFSIENMVQDTRMILNGIMFRSIKDINSRINKSVSSLLLDKLNYYEPLNTTKVSNIKNKLDSSKYLKTNNCTYLPLTQKDKSFKNYIGTMNISLSKIAENLNFKYDYSIYNIRNKLKVFEIDDITLNDYNVIKKYVIKNVKKIKQGLIKNRRELNKLQREPARYNKINEGMVDFIRNNYIKTDIPYTNDEIYNFLSVDAGDFFYVYLVRLSRDLKINITNQEILDLIEKMKQEIKLKENNMELNANSNIVKSYNTLKEMMDDNEKNIILRDPIDKKLNNIKYLYYKLSTDYEYTESIEVFADKLQEILKNYKIDEPEHENNLKLKEMFENEGIFVALITNIIDIRVRKNDKCKVLQLNKDYVYNGEKWIEIDKHEENIKKRRILKVKNTSEEFDELKLSILNDYLYNLLSEFETEKEKNIEIDDVEFFQNRFDSYRLDLVINKNNKINKILKYNKEKNKLATHFASSGYLSKVKFSPFLPLMNMIIGIEDLDRKYELIIKFIKIFTYDFNDPDWYYCILSNTKLFPKFLYKLAKIYSTMDMNNYENEIKNICLHEGSLSDNGDAWVHKNTGYVIQKIDFDTNYGYDETGFKIVLDTLGKDIHDLDEDFLFGDYTLQDIIEEDQQGDMKIKKEIVLNKEENIIYHLLISISSKVNFTFNIEHNKKALGKEVYKIIDFSRKYSKHFYKNKDEACLLSIMCFILVYIQCNDVIVERAVLGCIQSFEGFPLSINENENDGLIYMSCILHTLCNKNNSSPYNVYSRATKQELLDNLTDFMKKVVLQNSFVNQMLMEKRHKLNIDKTVQDDYEILVKNPERFKPTLYNLNVPDVDDFENKTNISDLLVLVNKNIEQYIQKFIQQETPILITQHQQPYLINYCCNMSDFILNHLTKDPKQSKIMDDLLTQSKQLEYKLLKKLIYQNTCVIKLNNSNIIPIIQDKRLYDETIIYMYIIHKCNFDNKNEIPSYLTKYIKEKPGVWYVPSVQGDWNTKNVEPKKATSILKEKITILKDHGFIYNIDLFLEIVREVHKQHIIDKKIKKEGTDISKSDKYEEFIKEYNLLNYVPDEVIDHFNSDILRYKSICTKYYLDKSNKILDKFEKIMNKFQYIENEIVRNQYINFLYNMNYVLINILPQLLLYGNQSKTICMKHWKLASETISDINSLYNNHYNYLLGTDDLIEEYKNLLKFKMIEYKDILNYEEFKNNQQLQFAFMEYLFYRSLSVYTLNDVIMDDDPKIKNIYETYNNILEYLNYSISSFTLDYNSIKKKYEQSKNSEKKIKTDRLKKMKKQQRDVEKNLMALKLGEWSYGTDKRVFKYVKEYYKKEKETAENIKEMMHNLYGEIEEEPPIEDVIEDEILEGQEDPRLLCPDDDEYIDQNGNELDGDEQF
jgi:hypothetical protein